MQILSNPISALNVRESPKFPRPTRNWGRETRWWRQVLDRKWKYSRFVHAPCIRPLQKQFVHCGRGYGAGTTFHRTYF